MLSAAAKNYVGAKNAEAENVQLKAECLSLKNENAALKNECDIISGQFHELKYEYDRFYDSVADDVEIAAENERLKKENEVIGNQVHTLSADVMALKQENSNLKADNEKLGKELVYSAEELTKTQTLLKSLQEKFDKVMEFIGVQKLKERLEEFLKPAVKHKIR